MSDKSKDLILKRAETAEHCITRVEDLFEYRYKGLTPDEIKFRVMSYIEQYSNELKIKEGS